jgi:cyclic beta-1,2-glucan synthetase
MSFRGASWASQEPIRAEVFSLEHLDAHARNLAASATSTIRRGVPLLRRFHDNRRAITRTHGIITKACRGQDTVSTDAEWFIDNFHIIEDALREVSVDLPYGYYSKLPKLNGGPLAGLPRVYALAIDLLAHTDSSLDETNLTRFVQAYQSITPLTIGELWAIPIMLRLALIENLRRLGQQMVATWQDRSRADELFGRLCKPSHATVEKGEADAPLGSRLARACAAMLSRALATMNGNGAAKRVTLTDPFIVRLSTKLRDFDGGSDSAASWMEERLAELDVSSADVVQRENQRQAANQVSVGNCVTSLRLLSALDWTAFFERASHVERILRDDPAGVYAQQDFATKDRYRQVIERWARGSNCDEVDVAKRVIAAARLADKDERRKHVGFHLIGSGRRAIESALRFRASFREWLLAATLEHPYAIYFGGLGIAIGTLLIALVAYLWSAGASSALIIIAALLSLLPASEIAIGLANYLVTLFVPPRVLPKLELREGIPGNASTFVVIPTMLLDQNSAANLAEHLEIHYLANPDPQLRFALLTDFADAPAERQPEDDLYVNEAIAAIQALNQRYGNGNDIFFLFHRRRMWNPVQGCWMGWERKRGKLLEFIRLLRGASDTSFSVVSGDLSKLPPIRYCVTLDSDTALPRDTARRLVGIIAHPLNRARYDQALGRVVEGYAILQPRVSFAITAATRSRFSRIFAGSAGIDPYTTAVSDVYHDLFGVGSYTGKGIFDIDAFHAAVGNTFPENHILSHDLIEGNYARCGLVNDVEMLDEFPARYDAYTRREHRWVRGDWQILPWLFRKVPRPRQRCETLGASRETTGSSRDNGQHAELPTERVAAAGDRASNSLTAIARWKIFDNLRRSLVPPFTLLLTILGWFVLPGSAWLWTVALAFVISLPLVLRLVSPIFDMFLRGRLLHPLRDLRGDLGSTAAQSFLSVVFLVDQSRQLVDAIVRTLVRLMVTRRRLLEWESAAATEKRLGRGFSPAAMWPVCLVAAILGVGLAIVRIESLPAALPLLLIWLASPAVAWWVSRPLQIAALPLTESEQHALRRIARKTWAFFETFVGDTDHWLPPDNFQEDPKGVIAHRTSPTNMGMLLLSTSAAQDLGYLCLSEMLDRLETTFHTFDQLDRFQGHFYNWYDTQSLRPLQPAYISTVDSGNMLGCLLALKQGLIELADKQPALPSHAIRNGLTDTLNLVNESFEAIVPPRDGEQPAVFRSIEQTIAALTIQLQSSPRDLAEWSTQISELGRGATELNNQIRQLADAIDAVPDELTRWADRLSGQIDKQRAEIEKLTGGGASQIWARCRQLAERAHRLACAMDFRFLYNERRHLFTVGFNAALGRADNSHYDLLASEACLTSLLAIARGQADQKHWFQLGRPLAGSTRSLVLVSWGGTMFEYLMPRLLLRSYPGTLLDESHRTAVARQIEYGRQRRVPWGISESAFSALDRARDYQYQSFGVPGLGLKRGLADELVIAPYATALALAVRPQEAIGNFRALAAEGAEGPFGLYEAIDYTRERLPDRQRSIVVRCFMAHHQGMSLAAIANCLLGDPMPRRFHADPFVRAVDLLLQERVPRSPTLIYPHGDEAAAQPPVSEGPHPMSRRLTTAHTIGPRAHLVSNGRYNVMVTNSGAGSATCRGIDISRWREDRTRDCWGQFIYVHHLREALTWSAGYQPICRNADEYEVIYSADKAEYRRLDGMIGTNLEVVVPPEDLAEIRRVTLVNHDHRARRLDVTSYVELVLGPHPVDLAHPAFGKLFLETEYLAAHDALLCRRRPRRDDEKPVWAVHVVAMDSAAMGDLQFETDRARFIGRGRTAANPAALEPRISLSGTTGPVLDPIFSLRRRVRVRPGASVSITFTTAIADSREEAIQIADRYHDYHAVVRAFELAWAHSQVELRHLQLSGEEAQIYQHLATEIIFAGPTVRPPATTLAANRQGQSALWRYGVSGDKPIVLVKISDVDDLPTVRRLLTAHAYLRLKGIEFDLVVLCEEATGYFEELYQQVQQLVRMSDSHSLVDVPGGVFARKSTQMPDEDRILIQAAARVVLDASRSLATQLETADRPRSLPPRLKREWLPATLRSRNHERTRGTSSQELLYWNGLGGFTRDGREYVIDQTGGIPTPAPWVNVVANRSFGFLVSETGSGFTWAGNSQMNRLTPCSNDPVCDVSGESIYLRDDASGEFWTPTPMPAGGPGGCVIRHGQGYTSFEHTSHGIEQNLLMLVPVEDPVKLIALTVRNIGTRRRRLSATFYAEWVLGTVRDQATMNLITDVDGLDGMIVARNPFNQEFASRVAFADVNLRPRTITADRSEFLGRNGTPSSPAALGREELSGRIGANLDPCAAVQVPFELGPGEESQIVFLLGQAENIDAARQLAARYRKAGAVETALNQVNDRWDRVLGAVQVRTPNAALDVIVNRWLLYQTLSCRIWGRSGFYQSSGAFGFRDQLQDVMALVYGLPQEARSHILYAASRQFTEGDVQHWWHPPLGRGVRTRCSDDYLWLPFAVCHYVNTTGDRAILDERVPFLQSPTLRNDQEEDYRLPDISTESATLYEHCVRAVEYGLRFGEHHLPLIGTCDWNDGYNRVGHHGRGESVWNGWFLLTNLWSMADVAESRGEPDRARRYREHAEQLRTAIEQHAWDGQWYLRAFFDDGTPLGSRQNDECQIDSLAQSWAVISGAADHQRAADAITSVHQRLVQPANRLIRLFSPAFNKSNLHPGYVKGYVPGIRENGGQYTHAANWVVQATALLGQTECAMQLFDMLNPITHTTTPADVSLYKVEPYVVVADIYSESPHAGRGGWTWYTGSAGWLYRIALEVLLGFQLRGDRVNIHPRIPSDWKQFEITFRYRSTSYHIVVQNSDERSSNFDSITIDGIDQAQFRLVDDGKQHEVIVQSTARQRESS